MEPNAASAVPAVDVPPPAHAPLPENAEPRSTASPPGRIRRRHIALLILILVVAAALRLYHLGHQAMWMEEFLTLQKSGGHGFAHEAIPEGAILQTLPDVTSLERARPWQAIWSSLHRDAAPPLYFVLVRGWRELLGSGEQIEATLRGVSVLASLASIALLFDIARRLHGSAAALWACALMAVAGPQIQFAQEAGPSALAMALALGAAAAVVRMQMRGPGLLRAGALIVCLLLMTLTTYFAAAAFVALGVYALLRLRPTARRQAVAGFILAGALFAVSWGPYAAAQGDVADGPLIFRDPHLLQHTAQRVALLPVRFLNEPMRSSHFASLFAVAAYVLPLLLLRRRPDLLLWALWAGAVIALVVVLDVVRQTYYTSLLRYTMIASPAAYALLAALLSHARRPALRHCLPAVALLSCLISLPRAYAYYFPPKPGWHELAGELRRLSGPRDGMLFYGTEEELPYLRALIFGYTYYLDPAPRPIVLLSTPPDARIREAFRKGTGLWVATHRSAREVVALLPGFVPDTVIYDPHLPTLYRLTPAPAPSTQRSTAHDRIRPRLRGEDANGGYCLRWRAWRDTGNVPETSTRRPGVLGLSLSNRRNVPRSDTSS